MAVLVGEKEGGEASLISVELYFISMWLFDKLTMALWYCFCSNYELWLYVCMFWKCHFQCTGKGSHKCPDCTHSGHLKFGMLNTKLDLCTLYGKVVRFTTANWTMVSEDNTFSTVSKRKIFLALGLGAVVLAVVLGVAIGVPLSKRSTSNLDKARELLEKYPLIDGWVIFNGTVFSVSSAIKIILNFSFIYLDKCNCLKTMVISMLNIQTTHGNYKECMLLLSHYASYSCVL